ncbi:MAG: 2-oxo acid dehydrogenase subunit E2, partial [Actinobacteria bacterium]|nr:2-oxo acid dehydrogenase subunit E2 [Actinomycetota bacterium]
MTDEQFGPNDWLVDEMFRKYKEDPASVSESWRDFFEDYRPRGESAPLVPQVTEQPRPVPPKEQPKPVEVPGDATPLRGAAAAIVKNMEASLEVPTATSVRTMPAKLLEENRRVINDYLSRGRGGKVSFTHIIGWAIVRALQSVPALNASYEVVDGKPYVVRHKNVNLGLAVDLERKDGSRTLLVPNIRAADTLDFAGYHAAYEETIRKVRTGKITPEDFDGTTVTLTNPGMIGTVLSVPRLMSGQGAIIGAGAIDYP